MRRPLRIQKMHTYAGKELEPRPGGKCKAASPALHATFSASRIPWHSLKERGRKVKSTFFGRALEAKEKVRRQAAQLTPIRHRGRPDAGYGCHSGNPEGGYKIINRLYLHGYHIFKRLEGCQAPRA